MEPLGGKASAFRVRLPREDEQQEETLPGILQMGYFETSGKEEFTKRRERKTERGTLLPSDAYGRQ